MRALIIGWSLDEENSGGMETHIKELCRNLVSSGHNIELTAPESEGMPFEKTGAKVHQIPCRIYCDSLTDIIRSVARYNKKIIAEFSSKRFDFDVIHSHDWLGAEAAGFLSKKYKKPWIHTVHSLEHIRAAENSEHSEKKISGIERRAILGCDRIITVSNLMKKEIAKKFRVPEKKISVIYNYSTFENENTSRKNPAIPSPPTVLFAGRLALQKGIGHLILAFSDVIKAVPSAKLVIAGCGNLEGSLKSLARSCGIEESVEFTGFVSDARLKELYSGADLFVSPSVFEPFGITVLDAANFGCPVIATKNTGCIELFSEGSVAAVKPENSGALAKEVIRLLGDEDARKNMAKRAKGDLKNADGWMEIAKKTVDAYSSKPD